MTQQDNAEFSRYLQEKGARDERLKVQLAEPPAPPRSLLNRRNILTLAAGTAVVGEAVTLGYPLVTGQSTASPGVGGAVSAQAQRHPIERELINPQADIGGRGFGDWVMLMPTKIGAAPTRWTSIRPGARLDLVLELRRLQSDLASPVRVPERRPDKGFELSTAPRAARTPDLWHPDEHRDPGPSFNIYRVRYDGAQMELMENVAETTGLGLGVHVTVNPRTPILLRHRRPERHRRRVRPAHRRRSSRR